VKKYSKFEKLVKIAMLVHLLKSFFGSMSFASRATLCSWKGSLYFLLYGFGQEFHRKKAGIHSGTDDYVEWFEEGDILICTCIINLYIWKYQNNRGSKSYP